VAGILLIVVSILKRFWLPITITLTIVGALWYSYHKGYQSCEDKMNRAIIEYQQVTEKELTALQNRVNELKAQLSNKPTLTDKENSCILSNNPYEVRCIK